MIEEFLHLKQIIDSKNNFVITSHINPDGDSIGSEVALAVYLTNKGKSVAIINQSPTPENLIFLAEIFPVLEYNQTSHDDLIMKADCFIVVDTNSPSRFNAFKETLYKSEAYKICIDHHLGEEPFADKYIIDTTVPATSELLYKIFITLDSTSITKPIADALYTGIMTDTGSFRYPQTDSETHRITAELLSYGVKPNEIFQNIYENGPINSLHLLGKALTSISLHHNGKVALMKLPRSVFTETNSTISDVENLTSYVLGIRGVVIGIVVSEQENEIKISFRSKGNIPVNELAKEYNGGGHKNAAGANIKGVQLNNIASDILEKVKSFL